MTGQIQKAHDYMYWEFPESGGQQAVRIGKWKGIRQNIKKGNLKVELFNLETDLKELTDISARYPEIVKKMEDIMVREHAPAKQDIFKMKAIGD